MESIILKNIFAEKDYKKIKNKIEILATDPINYIGILFLFLIVYLYFTGEFIYQLITIGYPIYIIPKYIDTPNNLIKYFFIYGHIQILNAVSNLMGLPLMYQVKLPAMCLLLYYTEKKPEWLDYIYNRVLTSSNKVCEDLRHYIEVYLRQL